MLQRVSRVLLGVMVAIALSVGGVLADLGRSADSSALAPSEQPVRSRLALEIALDGEPGRRLGLDLADSIEPFVAAVGLTGQSGAMVLGITRASPADRAGVQPGDLIVSLAGVPVRDASRLHVMLHEIDAEVAGLEVIRIGSGVGDLLEQLRAGAWAGNRDAILALGDAALFNLDGRGQPGAAEEHYRRAYELGDPRAAYRIGTMYANGRGVQIDLAEATRWYRIAAEAGVPAGQFALGLTWWTNRYWTGLALVGDYTEAARLFRLAAERNYTPSFAYLGAAYSLGYGVEQDHAAAAAWFDRAAALGDVDAMVRRAELMERGESGSGDPEGALILLRQAAHLGSVEANRRLGEKYWRGEGVAVHPLNAIDYLEVAAAQGDAASMSLIARILLSGYGVTRDAAGAVEWYFRAYQAGDAEAGYALALAHADGIGVEPDPGKVAGFMLEAMRRGSSDALAEMKGNADAWDVTIREDLQRLLRASGHYTGEIDGVFGPGTLRALDAIAGGG